MTAEGHGCLWLKLDVSEATSICQYVFQAGLPHFKSYAATQHAILEFDGLPCMHMICLCSSNSRCEACFDILWLAVVVAHQGLPYGLCCYVLYALPISAWFQI